MPKWTTAWIPAMYLKTVGICTADFEKDYIEMLIQIFFILSMLIK